MSARVIIVDDHPMLRRGLRDALQMRSSVSVVGEASTAAQAVSLATELEPDLIVMDIHLPDSSGIEATRRILREKAAIKVVIFTSDLTRSLIDDALKAGASAYVLKSGAVDELLHAIDNAMAGKLYVSPEASAGILEDYKKALAPGGATSRPLMTERETQLLKLLAEGRRNKEMAAQLTISIKTVEATRARIAKKLGCSSSAELVRYAIREGLVSP